MKNSKKATPAVDPKSLKKSTSSTLKTVTSNFEGQISRTDTGFRSFKYRGILETYNEVLLEGVATSWYSQTELDQCRIIKVVSGAGFLVRKIADKESETIPLQAGQTVALDGVVSFQISSNGNGRLELTVTQTAFYETSLSVLEHGKAPVEITDAFIKKMIQKPSTAFHRISGSRAAEQLEELRHATNFVRNLKRKETDRLGPTTPVANPEISTSAGINPRPSGGRFDSESAG